MSTVTYAFAYYLEQLEHRPPRADVYAEGMFYRAVPLQRAEADELAKLLDRATAIVMSAAAAQ